MLRHLPRTLLTYVVGFFATLGASIGVIVIAHFRPTSPRIDQIARVWSRAWLATAGVDLTITGADDVDQSRSYVVVANHASNFDIMACFLAVPLPIRYLAKKELFRVPLLARAMRAIGIVEVDRASRGLIHDQINSQANALVSSGRSVIIYPEGTRVKQGGLGAFKKGAFTMAVSAGLPVLPVTIHGSRATWEPGSFWIRGGPISVTVAPPIETEGMTQADTGALRDAARGAIERRLGELVALERPQS